MLDSVLASGRGSAASQRRWALAQRLVRVWCAPRWFWGVMFLTHLPAFLSAPLSGELRTAESHLLRLLLLGGSQLFFFLKLIDVPWLRINCGRRVWVSAVLILLLLHRDPLARLWTGQDQAYAACWALAVLSSAVTVAHDTAETPDRRGRGPRRASAARLRGFLRRTLDELRRTAPSSWELFRAWDLLLLRAGRVNRAPPLL
jgi:hypothetical protein